MSITITSKQIFGPLKERSAEHHKSVAQRFHTQERHAKNRRESYQAHRAAAKHDAIASDKMREGGLQEYGVKGMTWGTSGYPEGTTSGLPKKAFRSSVKRFGVFGAQQRLKRADMIRSNRATARQVLAGYKQRQGKK